MQHCTMTSPTDIFYLILVGLGIFIAACLIIIQALCICLICQKYSNKKVKTEPVPDRSIPVMSFEQIFSQSSTNTPMDSVPSSTPIYTDVYKKGNGNFYLNFRSISQTIISNFQLPGVRSRKMRFIRIQVRRPMLIPLIIKRVLKLEFLTQSWRRKLKLTH